MNEDFFANVTHSIKSFYTANRQVPCMLVFLVFIHDYTVECFLYNFWGDTTVGSIG